MSVLAKCIGAKTAVWVAGFSRLRRRVFATARDVLPEDRRRFVAPLFDRPASLFLAHVTYVFLSGLVTIQYHVWWGVWFLAANLGLLGIRCQQVWRAGRLRKAGQDYTGRRDTVAYMAAGLVFNASCGTFSYMCTLHVASEEMRVLALTVALAGSAGVAARNFGTPRLAVIQILFWLLPQVYSAFLLGTWHRVLAGLLLLFIIALSSIVRRLHIDLVDTLQVQRVNAALTARLDAALSHMSQGLVLYDGAGTLRVINRRFFALLGLEPDCIAVGQPAEALVQCCRTAGVVAAAERDGRADLYGAAAHSAVTPGVLRLADGRLIAVSQETLPDAGRVCTYEDITERQRNEARVAYMAHHDALTDLPNRVLFRDRLDQAVAGLASGERFVVACLDLDHFKTVNDTLGHGIGDQLLQAVATRLTGCMRQADLVARLGGDEFAVIMSSLTDISEAEILAARIIATVSDGYEIEGYAVSVGVSIGLAVAPRDGVTTESLLMHADLAMYAAKADGRGTTRLFDVELSKRLATRRELERDLRTALARQEFEMFYQPIVSLGTGQVVGFEALVRWNHAERGCVAPDKFIPFAEESGLIVELGEWVLQAACTEAARWQAGLMIAINLSPVQFRTGVVLQSVLRALEISGLSPDRLEIEITEAAVLGDTEVTLAALRHLRAIGVRVAFDDFGTGFSSLSYLHRFPFDKIKIDKSFIFDLATSESAAAIVRAITVLGSSLHLVTTAEGVETEHQLDLLRTLGCTQVQGYLFSPPCPAGEVPGVLRRLATREALSPRLKPIARPPQPAHSSLAIDVTLLA